MSEIERQRLILELLGRVLGVEGAERDRFLDRACAGDPELRAELESMLEDEPAVTGDFLGTPAAVRVDPSLGHQILDATTLIGRENARKEESDRE